MCFLRTGASLLYFSWPCVYKLTGNGGWMSYCTQMWFKMEMGNRLSGECFRLVCRWLQTQSWCDPDVGCFILLRAWIPSAPCWCFYVAKTGQLALWKLSTKFMSLLVLFWTAGDMSESKAKKIEIKDVDGRTLNKLIDYIYTAEIEVTEENVQVNSAAAHSSSRAHGHRFTAPFHWTLVTTHLVAGEETKAPKRLGTLPHIT